MSGKLNISIPYNEPVYTYGPGSPEKKQVKEALKHIKSDTTIWPNIIHGSKISSDAHESIKIPHNHRESLGKACLASEEHIHEAINACLEARKTWALLPDVERAGVFLKAADLLATKYRSRINAATMLAQSKTVYQAEIDAACELIDFFRFNAYYLQQLSEQQPLHSPAGQWNRLEMRGLEGFVFAVGPFNFSSISVNLAATPALTGCSVLWKPSLQALPASSIALDCLHEAGLPHGVINLVYGDPEMIGNIAMSHKKLAGVHFTGSTRTFKWFWKQVGKNIDNYDSYPRIVGETGGKDFIFAHRSANIDNLCTALVRGAFEYQGQKCSAASRAYIPKGLWKTLKPKIIETIASIKMGDPEDFTQFMSAVIDHKAFAKIKSYIDEVEASSDAEVICGGKCDDSKGYFIEPTVIETTNPQYKTMTEEIFGPVLTIYPYDDDKFEETLTLCDTCTPYALTGAIFAEDRHLINHMTQALRESAGNFYINDKPTGAVVGQQPFGGARASGTNDKAGSMVNLLKWINFRAIKENFLDMPDYRYPFMDER